MNCRYSRDAGDYLTDDGQPCLTDDYGDPTRHCTGRRCSNHIGKGEMTCARCIGRVRNLLRRIVELAALMPQAAVDSGVNSEAANLAGPAADPEAWVWRKVAAKLGGSWHLSLIEDDDEQHPYSVLGRWDMMIREDYDQPSDDPVSITNAADYIGRQLGRIAQDPNQEFALLERDLRKCSEHLENVLQNSQAPERGVHCPDCTSEETGLGPRLRRAYAHWCEAEDCTKIHYADDRGDMWVCPDDHAHRWDHETYTHRLEERRSTKRDKSQPHALP